MTLPPAFDPAVGLCSGCRHARKVRSARGSRFWLCARAADDRSLRKYPALPRLNCHAFAQQARRPSVRGARDWLDVRARDWLDSTTMPSTRADLAARYPTNDLLRDGTAVVFRLLAPADRDAMLSFAQALDEEDLLFLREDITAPEVMDAWLAEVVGGAEVASGETFTVLAEVGGIIAGYSSLHTEPARWTRRVGEIRVNVHPDYRGTGVGGALAGEIRHVAPALGVYKLSAQMPVDQMTARVVFERLGFIYQAILPGWVTDRDGNARDLVIMACDLPLPDASG